jgi:hypothetical protein
MKHCKKTKFLPMKAIAAILFLFVNVSFVFSQVNINPFDCGLTYGYDAAGNRVIRLVVQCAPPPMSGKTDTTESAASRQAPDQRDTLISQIQVTLYPNPTSGKFVLDFTQPIDNLEVMVVNGNGQVMLNQKTSGQKIPLDISTFAAGVYYVKVYTTKQEFAKIVLKN